MSIQHSFLRHVCVPLAALALGGVPTASHADYDPNVSLDSAKLSIVDFGADIYRNISFKGKLEGIDFQGEKQWFCVRGQIMSPTEDQLASHTGPATGNYHHSYPYNTYFVRIGSAKIKPDDRGAATITSPKIYAFTTGACKSAGCTEGYPNCQTAMCNMPTYRPYMINFHITKKPYEDYDSCRGFVGPLADNNLLDTFNNGETHSVVKYFSSLATGSKPLACFPGHRREKKRDGTCTWGYQFKSSEGVCVCDAALAEQYADMEPEPPETDPAPAGQPELPTVDMEKCERNSFDTFHQIKCRFDWAQSVLDDWRRNPGFCKFVQVEQDGKTITLPENEESLYAGDVVSFEVGKDDVDLSKPYKVTLNVGKLAWLDDEPSGSHTTWCAGSDNAATRDWQPDITRSKTFEAMQQPQDDEPQPPDVDMEKCTTRRVRYGATWVDEDVCDAALTFSTKSLAKNAQLGLKDDAQKQPLFCWYVSAEQDGRTVTVPDQGGAAYPGGQVRFNVKDGVVDLAKPYKLSLNVGKGKWSTDPASEGDAWCSGVDNDAMRGWSPAAADSKYAIPSEDGSSVTLSDTLPNDPSNPSAQTQRGKYPDKLQITSVTRTNDFSRPENYDAVFQNGAEPAWNAAADGRSVAFAYKMWNLPIPQAGEPAPGFCRRVRVQQDGEYVVSIKDYKTYSSEVRKSGLKDFFDYFWMPPLNNIHQHLQDKGFGLNNQALTVTVELSGAQLVAEGSSVHCPDGEWPAAVVKAEALVTGLASAEPRQVQIVQSTAGYAVPKIEITRVTPVSGTGAQTCDSLAFQLRTDGLSGVAGTAEKPSRMCHSLVVRQGANTIINSIGAREYDGSASNWTESLRNYHKTGQFDPNQPLTLTYRIGRLQAVNTGVAVYAIDCQEDKANWVPYSPYASVTVDSCTSGTVTNNSVGGATVGYHCAPGYSGDDCHKDGAAPQSQVPDVVITGAQRQGASTQYSYKVVRWPDLTKAVAKAAQRFATKADTDLVPMFCSFVQVEQGGSTVTVPGQGGLLYPDSNGNREGTFDVADVYVPDISAPYTVALKLGKGKLGNPAQESNWCAGSDVDATRDWTPEATASKAALVSADGATVTLADSLSVLGGGGSGGAGGSGAAGAARGAQPVPTLGEVGLLLSGLALAGAAAPALRRRREEQERKRA